MKKKKLLAVASQGGHLIQLLRLKPVFDRYQTSYVSNQYREGMEDDFSQVIDANSDEKLKLLVLFAQMAWIIFTKRPDVVISSGAAPGLIAIMLGKMVGAKTIWIDSIANAEELSLSGKKAGAFADLWLTQWPNLVQPTGPQYQGRVL
ncbi:glycosyltransferase family protein [Salinimonas iocasae]|uniref:UDP-N-acetylglucosamine--LPS N-acetylglucosamine transferase n=1 Tax=Salinimonas iocasae TaxID=2572577 RepID=A0A5B7YAF1_9ALTE|nr:UDP-N-acetylglucosamine--LPS N-acetylglucosamine transferase [Salinimonas iocasae]QCZ92622.1 UDP-N-acetylglucosamine--LPS N-acetylglucosamine transferase [Salinimonas iocasae]